LPSQLGSHHKTMCDNLVFVILLLLCYLPSTTVGHVDINQSGPVSEPQLACWEPLPVECIRLAVLMPHEAGSVNGLPCAQFQLASPIGLPVGIYNRPAVQ
jgi:hypothetical protein